LTVEDTQRIDIIGVDGKSGDVVLTIADHLDWSDEYDHLKALQEKLNTYLAFIESGQMNESYPSAQGRKPVIDVVFKYEPSSMALDFLERASPMAAAVGAELRSRVKS
jgi:hypothetical protein